MPIKGIWDRLIPLIFGPFYQSQLVIISPNLSKEAATHLAPLTNNTNKLGWLPLQTVLWLPFTQFWHLDLNWILIIVNASLFHLIQY